MKKNVVKGILSVVFVAAAGTVYLSMAKTPGEGDGAEVVLWEEAQTQPDKKETSESPGKDSVGLENIGNLLISAASENPKTAGEPAGADKEAQEEAEPVYVHVCGAVKEPGVYALPEGSRISDAVLCAGDFLPDAAKDYLNLAKRISDGQKIYVPSEAEAERFRSEGMPADLEESPEDPYSADDRAGQGETAQTKDSGYVNLNTAGAEELMTLPGIGKAKADAIVAYRNEHGMFSSCEELMQVPGIKESVYNKICDNITVGK